MRRRVWLAGACLLGGMLLVAVVGALRIQARAAEATSSSRHALAVVINEVEWAGHTGHTNDEWIELYNTTAQTISLDGWRLRAADGQPDLALHGDVPPHGFYLIERTDDHTISDLPADWIGSFGTGLSNDGETLILEDDAGTMIDTANASGSTWPAGSAVPGYRSMERVDPGAPDNRDNWASNDGTTRNGLDADGAPINGTPKAANSCYRPPVSGVAELVVAKSGPAAVSPGSPVTYHVALSNTGALTATSVRVTDTTPLALEFVTQIGPFPFDRRGRDLIWQIGDVPSGTVHHITVTGRVTGAVCSSFTNHVTATTTASEPFQANNVAAWTTVVLPPIRLYALAPANYWDSGEAVALVNLGAQATSLAGWRVNDAPNAAAGVSFPESATIEPGQILWLAQDGDGFHPVWGFDADWAAQATIRPVPTLHGDWPIGLFADAGDAAYLLDEGGNVVDALVYGSGAATRGWTGPAVPFPYASYRRGQVLYRKLDPATGLPIPDTDLAADWAQDPGDPTDGRKVRYPGWDLEDLFFPAEISTTANITLAAAPDGALAVVSRTIAAAQHRLLIEAYSLESVPLYQVISDRIRAGVAVTVLLESGPPGGMEDVEKWIAQRLHDPPASSVYFVGREAPRYNFQHAKVILVDDRRAVVSSDNFGENSMPADRKDNGTLGHRGFVAVTDSPGVVARLAEVFRRDCDPLHHRDVAPYDHDYAPPGSFTPLPPPDWTTYSAPFTAPLVTTATHLTVLHAPEHALRAHDGLLGLLGRAGAGDKVLAMQMSEPFTWTTGVGTPGLNPRLQALVAAAQARADVRILLDDYYNNPLDDDGNTAACVRINRIAGREGLSLTCRLANVTGLGIHAKVFAVSAGDERWVHIGGINGTENSNKNNREVALQFRSAEAYEWIETIFQHDWASSYLPMPHRRYLPIMMQNKLSPAEYPLITEVFVNPGGDDAGQEWIEMYSPRSEVSINGWILGDAIKKKDYGDGWHTFPAGARLLRRQVIVAAACATDFAAAYGFNPAYEWNDCNASVPDLVPAGSWEGFGIALGNTKDEVLLMNAVGQIVDSVAWGGKPRAGITPFTVFTAPFSSGASLKRYPPDTDTDDCGQDFYVSYYPSPGVVAGMKMIK